MFKIDDREIKQLEADLQTFARRAIPFASRNTLNSTAFTARLEWQVEVRNKLITRNKFTENSIRVDKAKGLDVSRQEAVVGSIAPYMEDQEFGGSKSKKGKEGVAIPTTYSAGQGDNARPRTRLPRKPNKMANIRIKHNKLRGSRKQRNLVAIQEAITTGNKYVFLDLSRRKGLFKIVGGKRNPRLKMVWDLTRQSVRIPATPTLQPTIERVGPLVPEIHKESLEFQLRRLNILR